MSVTLKFARIDGTGPTDSHRKAVADSVLGYKNGHYRGCSTFNDGCYLCIRYVANGSPILPDLELIVEKALAEMGYQKE